MSQEKLIEYYGTRVGDYECSSSFKQMNVESVFCLPPEKLDMQQITKVWVEPCILQKKILKASQRVSLEGQNITTYRLCVEGEVKYKVQYVALEMTQTLCIAHTNIPFCGFIVLPENINIDAPIEATVIIEDMYSEQVGVRCIYNNMTMMVMSDLCEPSGGGEPCKIDSCSPYSLTIPKSYFKEEMVCEKLSIPLPKPDVGRVIEFKILPEIIHTQLIKTPQARSYEGQYLSGLKLVVELKFSERVTYIANGCIQSVHMVNFETFKSIFVILPGSIEGKNVQELVSQNRITVAPYIEECDVRTLDAHTVYKCFLLLVEVKI